MHVWCRNGDDHTIEFSLGYRGLLWPHWESNGVRPICGKCLFKDSARQRQVGVGSSDTLAKVREIAENARGIYQHCAFIGRDAYEMTEALCEALGIDLLSEQ